MKLYSDDEDSSSDEEVGASDFDDFDPIQLNNLLDEEEKLNQRMLEDIIQAQEQIRLEEEGDDASNKQVCIVTIYKHVFGRLDRPKTKKNSKSFPRIGFLDNTE